MRRSVPSVDRGLHNAGPSGHASAPQAARPDPTADTLAAEVSALAHLDLYGLRVRWRRMMRRPAPEHLNRALLIRIMAYRMQARVRGDLDAESIRALDRIVRDHDRNKASGRHTAKSVPEVAPAPKDRNYRLGTMFLREHAGEMHRVTVARDGFEWKGNTYRSLSEIAKAITGTTWSGPRFFGLREAAQEKPEPSLQAAQPARAAPASSVSLQSRQARSGPAGLKRRPASDHHLDEAAR